MSLAARDVFAVAKSDRRRRMVAQVWRGESEGSGRDNLIGAVL